MLVFAGRCLRSARNVYLCKLFLLVVGLQAEPGHFQTRSTVGSVQQLLFCPGRRQRGGGRAVRMLSLDPDPVPQANNPSLTSASTKLI